jgi:hypothetical protein
LIREPAYIATHDAAPPCGTARLGSFSLTTVKHYRFKPMAFAPKITWRVQGKGFDPRLFDK